MMATDMEMGTRGTGPQHQGAHGVQGVGDRQGQADGQQRPGEHGNGIQVSRKDLQGIAAHIRKGVGLPHVEDHPSVGHAEPVEGHDGGEEQEQGQPQGRAQPEAKEQIRGEKDPGGGQGVWQYAHRAPADEQEHPGVGGYPQRF